jgi:hypothetical protein
VVFSLASASLHSFEIGPRTNEKNDEMKMDEDPESE